MCRPELIGASGLRSSCASVARNSSLRRSASCSASTARRRSVMSMPRPYSIVGLPSASYLARAARLHPAPLAGRGVLEPEFDHVVLAVGERLLDRRRQPFAVLRARASSNRRAASKSWSSGDRPKIAASSGLHHTVSSTRSRDHAPIRPARIASASTSRFSRSAAAARALSTANRVRSATCSSRLRFVAASIAAAGRRTSPGSPTSRPPRPAARTTSDDDLHPPHRVAAPSACR